MVRVRHFALPLLALLPILNGCAKRAEVAAPPPPPPAPVVAAPKPLPPMGAAPNLTLPVALADGGFPTPNRALSPSASVWHLRAALNVAVLQCGRAGDPVEIGYNGFLKAHRAALASAHTAVAGEFRTRHGKDAQDAFDDAMTRLYNFYAQPPVRADFCSVALPIVAEAATATDLAALAPRALAALDAPFVDFYRSYAAYRVELAAWQSGQAPTMTAQAAPAAVPAAPRLEVDRAVLMAGTQVTMRGMVRTAAR